jgi:hypothetical protein
LGKDFQDLLNRYHIKLQTNVKGDHYALGVIDRFIRTLKERLQKVMIKNKSSNWIDHIDQVIKQYNESPHSALDGLSPDDVEMNDENIDLIQQINIAKTTVNQSIQTKTVGNLQVGDTVRIRKKGTFNKGTEAQFGTKKLKITKINSKRITLDDGKTYIDHDVLKVVDDGEQDVNVVDEVNRQGRIRRAIRDLAVAGEAAGEAAAAAAPIAAAGERIVARRPRRVENYANLRRVD